MDELSTTSAGAKDGTLGWGSGGFWGFTWGGAHLGELPTLREQGSNTEERTRFHLVRATETQAGQRVFARGGQALLSVRTSSRATLE